MDLEAARTARESLDLVFHMSNILDTGLDRPEALAALIKELRRERPSSSSSSYYSSSSLPAAPSSVS